MSTALAPTLYTQHPWIDILKTWQQEQEDARTDETIARLEVQRAQRQQSRHAMTQLFQGDVQPTPQDDEPNGGC